MFDQISISYDRLIIKYDRLLYSILFLDFLLWSKFELIY